MNKHVAIVSTNVCLALFAGSATGYVDFNDGGSHTIDYVIGDYLRIDRKTPGAGTQLELVDGGRTTSGYHLQAFSDAVVTVSGGVVGMDLVAYGRSRVTLCGGVVDRYVAAFDETQVRMSAGTCSAVVAYENSRVTVSGGIITNTWNGIYAGRQFGEWHTSLITFDGTDFAIDGEPVGYGDFASDYAGARDGFLTGTLAGTLSDGQALDHRFFIYDGSDITFVPEPAGAMLLALGGIFLHRRRTA